MFDDFEQWINATGAVADTPWVDTLVGTSTVGVVADEPFGAIVLTADVLENDGVQIQWATENFTVTLGKKMWFKARMKLAEATQSDFLVGLTVLDTAAIAASLDGVTDGVFFQKDDGSTDIKFSCQLDATTGQATPVTVATASTSYVVLGFEFDGVNKFKLFVNDVQVGTMDLGTSAASYLPNTPITPTIALLAGTTGGTTLTVDYIFAAIER